MCVCKNVCAGVKCVCMGMCVHVFARICVQGYVCACVCKNVCAGVCSADDQLAIS